MKKLPKKLKKYIDMRMKKDPAVFIKQTRDGILSNAINGDVSAIHFILKR